MKYASSRLFFYLRWAVACLVLSFQLAQAQTSPSVSPGSVATSTTVSPGSVATSTTVSPGVQRWTVTDPTFMAHVNGRTTIPDPTASSNGDITVRSSGNVVTRNGNVAVSVSRKIKYSDLIKPWKSFARAVPFVGTGLAIYDVLNDLCLKKEDGSWFTCTFGSTTVDPYPAWHIYVYGHTPFITTDPLAVVAFYNANIAIPFDPVVSYSYINSTLTRPPLSPIPSKYLVLKYASNITFSIPPVLVCNSSGASPVQGLCPVTEQNGWEDLGPDYDPGPALDDYPASPKYKPTSPPQLFDQLPTLEDQPGVSDAGRRVTPSDNGSPQVSGSTDPVTGPSTTQSTSSGTTVTNNTSHVTYQGDTTTVTNKTTVTYINNAGDVINQETTSDNQPTECEQNPNAVSCQDLGAPPNGEIPKSDQPWSITPESLPGGSCPPPLSATFAGKTHSISFTPLCNALPDVRMVVLLLSGVMAAWIVAGGLKS